MTGRNRRPRGSSAVRKKLAAEGTGGRGAGAGGDGCAGVRHQQLLLRHKETNRALRRAEAETQPEARGQN